MSRSLPRGVYERDFETIDDAWAKKALLEKEDGLIR